MWDLLYVGSSRFSIDIYATISFPASHFMYSYKPEEMAESFCNLLFHCSSLPIQFLPQLLLCCVKQSFEKDDFVSGISG
eukprot:c51834_g1_i1 orf=71-307(+)